MSQTTFQFICSPEVVLIQDQILIDVDEPSVDALISNWSQNDKFLFFENWKVLSKSEHE